MGTSRRLTTWLLLWMLLLPADTAAALAGPRAPAPHVDVEMLAPDVGEDAPACDVPGVNTVYCENQRPGAGPEEWDLPGQDAGDPSIQGFATDMSVNLGETIRFKIDSTTPNYGIEIFRLGYYQGLGARRIATVAPNAGVPHEQPNCLSDPQTGLIDCGNWAVSASWTVPAIAVSGVYLARLEQTLTGAASHIIFVVRDDTRGSDLLFQTSDTTWQAYNDYAGNSLYRGVPAGRAYKVSYNRPLITRGDPGAGRATALFNAEYPMIRWLEANGYDVSYTSGVDTDRRGAELLEHNVFLSVGHDEYWSGEQRANVEAARDAGVHLAFFSGNEIFWKTRWETSIDGSGTPHRTLVCYKETEPIGVSDPSGVWTGTWRDPLFGGGRPENALTGTLFKVNGTRADAIRVPAAFASHRFWRNTSIALLQPGQTAVLPAGTLGYEWDEAPDDASRPAGLQRLSSTTLDVSPLYLQDSGTTYGPGTATHSMTLYRAASGALVFSAGTVQWSWGLDSHHDRGAGPASPEMQQATVNLLADMGVHSDTLQAGLASGADVLDISPPTSIITTPPAGAVLRRGEPMTISGTASDDRALAGVEVSVDGGATWAPAVGLANWTFNWTPAAAGPVTLESRAFDQTGNMQAAPSSVAIAVTRDCPCTIWDASVVPPVPASDDPAATELGMRFRADTAGVITGIRFYKGPGNGGTHTGSLWAPDGTLLARAAFTNETAEGWQQVDFATAVSVSAGVTYIASYHAPLGRYAMARPSASSPLEGFAVTVNNPPLRALADNEEGGNGLFVYSGSPAFPVDSFGSTNYFVDVVFEAGISGDSNEPFVTQRTPLSGATGVAVSTLVTARFNKAIDPATVTPASVELLGPSGIVAGALSYEPATRAIVLDPSLPLADNTSYRVTIHGGPGGVADLSGVPLSADVSWTFTTAPPVVCPCTIWPATTVPGGVVDNIDDTLAIQSGIELGVRFRAERAGVITALRFYKSQANTGPHTGTLWTDTGTELATATLAPPTSAGWQEMTFASPVAIEANQTYVASYHAPAGRYSVDAGYFAEPSSANFTRPPLRALVSGPDAANGVFAYGPRAFPTDSFNASNYWVDVVFEPAPDNTAPVASADSYATRQGGVLTVAAPGVLANDTDAEATPLTAVLVDGPVNGTLALNADGSFTYTPGASFSGTDSFVYTASDGLLDSNPAVVTIGVEAVNHAPVASSQSLSAVEDTALPVVLAAVDPDGDPLAFTIATSPAHGTLSGTAQSLTYTPGSNVTGADAFTYTVTDGRGGTAIGTVDVTIAPVNDAPVAVNDSAATTEDSAIDVGVIANDTDIDSASTALRVQADSIANVRGGTAVLIDGRTVRFTPASNANDGNTPGGFGFTYRVSDGTLVSANQGVVTITVAGGKDAPAAVSDSYSVDEDRTLGVPAPGVLANDTDADGDPVTAVLVGAPLPAQGSLSLAADGSFAFVPATNFSGTVTFTYRASDGTDPSNLATVTIAVNPVNDAPTLSAIASQDLTVGTASTPIAFTIGDVETAADALTLSASSSNTAVVPVANITFGGAGANRTVTVAPASAGSANVTVTVRDAADASASRTFVVTAAAASVATTTTLSSPTASPTTYGQAVVLTATVARTTGGAAPTGSVDFLDNGVLLNNVNLTNGAAPLTTSAIGAGARTITAVYRPAAGFAESQASITRTVNKATATGAFVTVSPLRTQYSDRVLMEATVSPATAAESVTFQIGTAVLGTIPVVNGKASGQVPLLGSPGSRMVTAVFNSANYTIGNVGKSVAITKEDARLAYTGPATLCLCGSASVPITIDVSDISATMDAASDQDPGDIGTATVTFINRTAGTSVALVTVTPDSVDARRGTATYYLPASALGSASSRTLTFGFTVSGNYTRNSMADDVTVTITK